MRELFMLAFVFVAALIAVTLVALGISFVISLFGLAFFPVWIGAESVVVLSLIMQMIKGD